MREYLITKYLEASGLTTIAHCLMNVRFISPESKRSLNRPAILMEHIQGPSVQEILDTIIYNYCPHELITKSLGDKEKWAYESNQFESVRLQLERSILTLQNSYGIKCSDHCENMNNIILQPNGLILIIDFSAEVIPPHLRKVINEKSEVYLLAKLPIDIYKELKRKYSP
jgi:hypothetical protein